MKRREFLISAVAPAADVPWGAAAEEATPAVYFADGWHGGVAGHMPAGAWRDILDGLRRMPDWKICLEIEPISWDYVRREDPEAYQEIRRYLRGARVEMVGGSYGQPFAWAFGGESNIRHLTRAREILREHFPDIKVDTYAVQEPCWTSAMPQILRSAGFARAVLKNNTTTAGYTMGFDADLVAWTGPDGTWLPAVPRYACEELVHPHKLESCFASPEYARKCVAQGIRHPSGMHLQDLGWSVKKAVTGAHVRFVTWREYCESVADQPPKPWRFTQEEIRITLPWGEKSLQKLAREVRSAENRLLVAEKVAAMARVFRQRPFPAQRLREAWDLLLMAQHHDSWICAKSREGRENWAWKVGAWTWGAEQHCDAIIAGCTEAMAAGGLRAPSKRLGPRWVRVFNTLGASRDEVAELTLAADPGTQAVRVIDGSGGEVVAQVVRTRSYKGDGSIAAANLIFPAQAPAMGYATYRVEPQYEKTALAAPPGAVASRNPDGSIAVETDLYSIRLDAGRGAVLTSLYAKDLRKEFCDPHSQRSFNEYRGYFIAEKTWASSADKPAKVEIIENGPVRVRVAAAGEVLGRPFRSVMTLAQGQRRIDFHVRFDFGKETWIGDPWWSPGKHQGGQRRSHHNDLYKLQALFPMAAQNRSVDKNCAFDVCRSRDEDTFFTRWDSIKHNIIVNWVDVLDGDGRHGLALLSDHTTSYAHGQDHPLALILAWGWVGSYYTGKSPLSGDQQVSYALIPHAGAWDQAKLSEACARWSEPLLTQLMRGEPAPGDQTRSLVAVSGGGVETPAVLVDGDDLLVRLFNAEGDDAPRTVSLAVKPSRVELVELDGTVIRQLDLAPAPGGRFEVRLAMPRFGIRTLRCRLAPAAEPPSRANTSSVR